MFAQVTSIGTSGSPVPLSFLQGPPFMNSILFSLKLAGPVDVDFAPPLPTQRVQNTDQGISLIVQVLDGSGVPVNLRGATAQGIVLVRPSGVGVDVKAAFYTTGIDGKMSFVTGAASPLGTGLDEVGTWLVQGHVTIAGHTQFTEVSAFIVNANLLPVGAQQ